MAEQLDTLIQVFELIEEARANITLVGDIRLDPVGRVVLIADEVTGLYPTTGEHYVIGPLFQPTAVRQWVGFQAFINHIQDHDGVLTSDGYRLHDGTDQWWWDGAWVVATTDTEWSSEADVANNIATFVATTRKLRPVVRLISVDGVHTPSLSQVNIAWKGKVFFLEDLIYRSLVPLLRAGSRHQTDFAFKVRMPGGLTLPTGGVIAEAGIPFNVIDVVAAFNHNLDPDHVNNLLVSYDNIAKKVTLSTAIPVGAMAVVRLLVEPEISVETASQDFIEVEKVPALVVANIEAVTSSPYSQDEGCVNKDTGVAIRLPAPYRFDLRFTMIASTPGGVDLMRMTQSLVEMMDNLPFVTAVAIDRKYRLWLQNEFSSQTAPSKNDVHRQMATAIIKDVVMYTKKAVVEQAVSALRFRGSVNVNSDDLTPMFP